MGESPIFRRLLSTSLLLVLCVVVLGAWVRLSDAGLGCPDWPGCYGQLLVPERSAELARANELYPERPVEVGKAWREMIHRYAAGGLGLLVLAMAVVAWRRRNIPGQPVAVPLTLVGLIIFQALLGMWTVTLLLKPAVVTAHLLGGMTTLSLIWWLLLEIRPRGAQPPPATPTTRRLGAGFLLLVACQIALGGWTSANYAALACTDFPTCYGQWWPNADFREGFVLWRGLGVDYEFGVLDHPARVAIHWSHRVGALLVAACGLLLAWRLRADGRTVQAGLLLGLLGVQLTLGVLNVMLSLPLPVAVAHNAGAALLLMLVLAINHGLWRRPAILPAVGPGSAPPVRGSLPYTA